MSDPVFSKDATGAGWFFVDETGDEYGPYRSERSARKHLKRYCHWLTNGPTWWQAKWWPLRCKLKEFWDDTRGTRQRKGEEGAGTSSDLTL